MKIILLTPGTGSYHCGVCMRDNAMARELIAQGHEALLLPLYLPLTLDEKPASPWAPIFYGGIGVYLQQKFEWFRSAPRWLLRLLSQPLLLRWAGRQSGMTGGAELGELTHSMLLGEHGHQRQELENLVGWLRANWRPDAIWLSTGLLVGMARRLREALGVPVLCSLQGEDSFLDSLAEPWRTRCWTVFAERCADLQRLIAPSQFYADLMGARLGSSSARVIYNGIALDGFAPSGASSEGAADSGRIAIGYLARFTQNKGLALAVDAFIELKHRGRFPLAVLRCAGAMTDEDAAFVQRLREQLHAAGCADEVEFLPNVSREQKLRFLQSLTLLSVPATYAEAFGLYLIEALAAGVPVVQPRRAAFTEVVTATGGGLLYDVEAGMSHAEEVAALVDKWELLLENPQLAEDLGRNGRLAVEEKFSVTAMTRSFVAQTLEIIDAAKAGR